MKTKMTRAHADVNANDMTVHEIYTFEVTYAVTTDDVNKREALMNQLWNLANQYKDVVGEDVRTMPEGMD